MIVILSAKKFLTFYYNFFEELKKHRSYALLSFKESLFSLKPDNRSLGKLKKEYKMWAKGLLYQAMDNDEIASRSKLSDTYDSLFWYQFLFLINFWRKDKSRGFEKTDAAIEKSVNLSFDLIEKNALDSAFDFGKFTVSKQMMEEQDKIPTSRISRAGKFLNTGAKVGGNYLKYYGKRVLSGNDNKDELQRENAEDIYNALGNLKGGL